jgi:serine/threonine-protein kinase
MALSDPGPRRSQDTPLSFESGEALRVARVGDVIAGRYELLAVLGAGGMGTVFTARHTVSGRRVALKWIPLGDLGGRDLRARFVREAQALGRIDHPNVVGVLDAGVQGGGAYLAMELVRGESLRDHLDRTGPLPVHAALQIMLQVMQGVAAAHRCHVIHRDLKPDNLVTHGSGDRATTKVLDFGISKLAHGAEAAPGPLTQDGHVVGTPHYMAPEQANARPVDGRADVWALGVMLYEMLSGALPFDRDGVVAVLIAIATEPPVPLTVVCPELDRELADVVHRALAKDPEERWPSVVAFALALEPFADAVFAAPPPPSEFPPPMGRSVEDACTPHATGHVTTPHRRLHEPATPMTELHTSALPSALPTAWGSGKIVAATLLTLATLSLMTWTLLPDDEGPPEAAAGAPPVVSAPAPALPASSTLPGSVAVPAGLGSVAAPAPATAALPPTAPVAAPPTPPVEAALPTGLDVPVAPPGEPPHPPESAVNRRRSSSESMMRTRARQSVVARSGTLSREEF